MVNEKRSPLAFSHQLVGGNRFALAGLLTYGTNFLAFSPPKRKWQFRQKTSENLSTIMVVPITAARTVPDLNSELDRIPYLTKNTRYSIFWSPMPQHIVIVNKNETMSRGYFFKHSRRNIIVWDNYYETIFQRLDAGTLSM